MGLIITKQNNGIMFDVSDLPGSGTFFASKKFIPSNFGNIDDVLLYNDRVVGNSSSGKSYSFAINSPNEDVFNVSKIGVDDVNTLEEIFEKFIALL